MFILQFSLRTSGCTVSPVMTHSAFLRGLNSKSNYLKKKTPQHFQTPCPKSPTQDAAPKFPRTIHSSHSTPPIFQNQSKSFPHPYFQKRTADNFHEPHLSQIIDFAFLSGWDPFHQQSNAAHFSNSANPKPSIDLPTAFDRDIPGI
mmetsp:Transcript_2145/g.4623  ORF Transcript_2145/g.4623 Transcript_2145/m.4623 type:complete len:146 (+) Transcript_2145:126-563(+)